MVLSRTEGQRSDVGSFMSEAFVLFVLWPTIWTNGNECGPGRPCGVTGTKSRSGRHHYYHTRKAVWVIRI